ncbi:MAG: class I tRNA ligase family protein [Candidatus Peribacteria bacterium]|nr:MAG: class I tRNA ligase family protein [Candidatus Peribacteria bacterium]
MSKTLGNVISPFEQVEKYGLDAFRYYMIAGIPTFGDASYREEDLVALYHSRLANSFGNLLNRVIHLAAKKAVSYKLEAVSPIVQEKIDANKQVIASYYDGYDLYNAADEIHKLAIFANEYISRPGHEPWNKEVSDEEAKQVLVDCTAMLQVIIDGYAPILPETCARAQQLLDTQEKGILFQRIGS